MNFKVNVSANAVKKQMAASSARAKTIAEETTRQYGARLFEEVRNNASGAPGPNVVTGQYLSSIRVRFFKYRNSLTAEVYSEEPYSARLEYGYRGTDRNGRLQFSRPYPHFRPAFDRVSQEFEGAMNRIAAQL